MSTVKKKTQVELYREILATLENAEHIDFINSRIEQCEKKNTTRKPTAEQLKAKSKAEELAEFFKANPTTMFTVSELIKKAPCFNTMSECSTSYATSIVTKLRTARVVERTEVKGRAYYQYAE